MPLYFAYGSNMLRRQMDERCPGAQFAAVGLLQGWRFLINARGVATMVQDPAACVWGVVWELSADHLRVLDGYEGVPDWYQRETVSVHLPGRGEVKCVTYIDRSAGGDVPGAPRAGYLEKLQEGAARFRLPRAYRESLASFAPDAPPPESGAE